MKKFLSLAIVLMLAVTLLAGCGKKEDIPSEEGTGLSGKIVIAGSTSVQPLSEELSEAFFRK